MPNVMYFIAQIAMLILTVLDIAMLVRAITSWFPDIDGWLIDLVYSLTEPLIIPVRAIFDKLGFYKKSPFDFSFIIAFMLLSIVRELLSSYTAMVI